MNFEQHYKNLDSQKIVSILRNWKDYNPEAIDAAKNELSRRNLSEVEINEINSSLDLIDNRKILPTENQQKFKSSIDKKAQKTEELLFPEKSQTEISKMKTLAILLIVSGLFALYSQFGHLLFYQSASYFHYFQPTDYMVIATIVAPIITGGLFWFKSKIGYLLMLIFSIISIFIGLASLLSRIPYLHFPDSIIELLNSIMVMIVVLLYIRFLRKEEIKTIFGVE